MFARLIGCGKLWQALRPFKAPGLAAGSGDLHFPDWRWARLRLAACLCLFFQSAPALPAWTLAAGAVAPPRRTGRTLATTAVMPRSGRGLPSPLLSAAAFLPLPAG